jgi:hypothetical protein
MLCYLFVWPRKLMIMIDDLTLDARCIKSQVLYWCSHPKKTSLLVYSLKLGTVVSLDKKNIYFMSIVEGNRWCHLHTDDTCFMCSSLIDKDYLLRYSTQHALQMARVPRLAHFSSTLN